MSQSIILALGRTGRGGGGGGGGGSGVGRCCSSRLFVVVVSLGSCFVF